MWLFQVSCLWYRIIHSCDLLWHLSVHATCHKFWESEAIIPQIIFIPSLKNKQTNKIQERIFILFYLCDSVKIQACMTHTELTGFKTLFPNLIFLSSSGVESGLLSVDGSHKWSVTLYWNDLLPLLCDYVKSGVGQNLHGKQWSFQVRKDGVYSSNNRFHFYIQSTKHAHTWKMGLFNMTDNCILRLQQ